MIPVTQTISLNENEIVYEFVRATGPGGQNVNKVATAVQLRFDAANSLSLPPAVQQRLLKLAGKRLTTEGILIIEARRFRTQEQNRQDALDRLVALIRQAAEPPKPRRPTRPTLASRERRMESKQHRSQVKRTRRSAPNDET